MISIIDSTVHCLLAYLIAILDCSIFSLIMLNSFLWFNCGTCLISWFFSANLESVMTNGLANMKVKCNYICVVSSSLCIFKRLYECLSKASLCLLISWLRPLSFSIRLKTALDNARLTIASTSKLKSPSTPNFSLLIFKRESTNFFLNSLPSREWFKLSLSIRIGCSSLDLGWVIEFFSFKMRKFLI